MPVVNGKEYPYTAKGMAMAKAAAKKKTTKKKTTKKKSSTKLTSSQKKALEGRKWGLLDACAQESRRDPGSSFVAQDRERLRNQIVE